MHKANNVSKNSPSKNEIDFKKKKYVNKSSITFHATLLE